MQEQVRAIPEGFHTITPHLVCAGALDAIEFYKKAFGAVETGRMPGPGGKIMHAQLRIGDSPIMLADDFPEFGCNGPQALKGTPVFIHLYVNDADAVFEQARGAPEAVAQLLRSPVVELNRAVALGMAYGPAEGLALADQLLNERCCATTTCYPACAATCWPSWAATRKRAPSSSARPT